MKKIFSEIFNSSAQDKTAKIEMIAYLAKWQLRNWTGKNNPCAIDFNQAAIDSAESKPQHANDKKSRDKFYRKALKDRQYTFYADNNHSDTRIPQFFFGKENVDNMIKAGVKHVFLERPQQQQKMVDDLCSGTVSEKEFAETYSKNFPIGWLNPEDTLALNKQMAKAIAKLHKNGVKTHFVDDHTSLQTKLTQDELQSFRDMQTGLRDTHDKACGHDPKCKFLIHGNLHLTYIFNSLSDPNSPMRKNAKGFAKAGKTIMDERFDDSGLAERIQKIAGNERSAIMYGAGHGMKDYDLDNLLGRDNVTRVELHGDKFIFADTLMRLSNKSLETDPADFRHFIEDGTVYEADGQKSNSLFKPS